MPRFFTSLDRDNQNSGVRVSALIRATIYLTHPCISAMIFIVRNAMNREPESLQEAVIYFADPDNCIDYLAVRRWPDGVVICPTCGSKSVSAFNTSRRTWMCSTHHPKREFSIKVSTIFAESPISLDKWLMAMWMLTNCKNGVSSCEIAKDVKVTQKSAWFMMHRIRLAMQDEAFGKLSGEVEVDETFIGGKARNMHVDKR